MNSFGIKDNIDNAYQMMFEETITLKDIYGDHSDIESSELVYQMTEPGEFDDAFTIKELTPVELRKLTTMDDTTTVVDSFEYASDDSISIVEHYKNNLIDLKSTPLVIMRNVLLDGNHRCVAAVAIGEPLKCIDIMEVVGE
jgi:hypothetical protein